MTPLARRSYISKTRLLRAILTSDSGSAEKIGQKRGIEKLFWPKNKSLRLNWTNSSGHQDTSNPRILFFGQKSFSIPLFGPIFSAEPESDVRTVLRSFVFEQYGLFAGGVIIPDHRQSLFVQKLRKLCPTTPPPLVSINIFQIRNILNFKVSPNFAKNWAHRWGGGWIAPFKVF